MLDDHVMPYHRRRQQLLRLAYLRKVLTCMLAVLVLGNTQLLIGVNGTELHLLQGVRLSLALTLATSLGGTFLGLFIACIPFGSLTYLHKFLPAGLAGMVLVNACIALARGFPVLAGLF